MGPKFSYLTHYRLFTVTTLEQVNEGSKNDNAEKSETYNIQGKEFAAARTAYVFSNLGDPINREGGHCEIS